MIIKYKNEDFHLDEFLENSTRLPEDAYYDLVRQIIISWKSRNENFSLKTSGSTAEPKLIPFTRQQLILSANQTIDYFGLKSGDTLFCCLSPTHAAGFMMLIRSLVIGMNLYLIEPSSNPLKDIEAGNKADFAAFIPLQLINILEQTPEKISFLDTMKAIILGGGIIPSGLLNKIDLIKCPVYETFGMTETLTHFALKRINGPHPDKSFRLMPGVEISKDKKDCLVVKSEVTLQREVATNDIIHINPDNTFDWLGRTDQTINSGGYKIQIESTENAINKILKNAGIELNSFLFKVEDEKLGERIEMMVEKTDKMLMNDKEIKELLKKSLHTYEIPKKIHFTASFEFTSLGKIDKRKTISLVKEDF